jgi:hypothetical protein
MDKYTNISNQFGALLAECRKQDSNSIANLVKDHEYLPQDFIEFLQQIGWGEIGSSQLMIYSGPLRADEIYDAETSKKLAGFEFFADDMAGGGYAFKKDGDSSVYVYEPGEEAPDRLYESFYEFIHEFLRNISD